MEVIDIQTFRKKNEGEHPRPRRITFRGSKFTDDSGLDKTVNINVIVENGDALGILKVVMEDGGIGQLNDDGIYYFLPWPCACVEIADV